MLQGQRVKRSGRGLHAERGLSLGAFSWPKLVNDHRRTSGDGGEWGALPVSARFRTAPLSRLGRGLPSLSTGRTQDRTASRYGAHVPGGGRGGAAAAQGLPRGEPALAAWSGAQGEVWI